MCLSVLQEKRTVKVCKHIGLVFLSIFVYYYGWLFEPFFLLMRKYRLVLILKSDLKKEEKEKLLVDVKKWSGKIEKEKVTDLGEKKFAYTIKKHLKGDYVLVEFEADSVSTEFDNKLRVHSDILRHLLVRMD